MAELLHISQKTGKRVLNHVALTRFGKWARQKVEEHPELQVTLEPSEAGYRELGFRTPKTGRSISAMPDTGAQMMVVGDSHLQALGISREELIPVGMKIKAANNGGMKLLGGILVKVTGKSPAGQEYQTQQLAYVVESCERIFLSKTVCQELGIISPRFPEIGEHCRQAQVNQVQGVGREEEPRSCSCQVRQLPPLPPKQCPYPTTGTGTSPHADLPTAPALYRPQCTTSGKTQS